MCRRVCKASGRYPNRAEWSQCGAEWGPHGAEWSQHGFARGTRRSEGGGEYERKVFEWCRPHLIVFSVLPGTPYVNHDGRAVLGALMVGFNGTCEEAPLDSLHFITTCKPEWVTATRPDSSRGGRHRDLNKYLSASPPGVVVSEGSLSHSL